MKQKNPNLISKGKGAKKDGIRIPHGRQVISLWQVNNYGGGKKGWNGIEIAHGM